MGILLLIPCIWLQFYWSKKKSKWLGLILPIISVLSSLLLIMNIIMIEGTPIIQILYTFALALLIGNIPTCVLLAIYFSCRSKLRFQH